ncbi:hypothetical protein TNCV_2697901 [Trichonephila clavipes]|nr:hypothetical protein TNCV_2697901 [Trichonephila clavipes]
MVIFKIGFAYCQWGAELLSLLCRSVCNLHSLSSDNKQWPRSPVIPQLVDRKTFRDNRWRKSDEGVVDVDNSISRRSDYQSNSSEWNTSRLDRSQGFRSSESGEKTGRKEKKTSVAGDKSGQKKKTANQRPIIDGCRHPRRLLSKLRREAEGRRRTLENFQPEVQGTDQRKKDRSSQAGSSKGAVPSQEQRRNDQESRFSIFRKNSASPGGTSPVQKRTVQKIKPVPLQISSTVQTKWRRS